MALQVKGAVGRLFKYQQALDKAWEVYNTDQDSLIKHHAGQTIDFLTNLIEEMQDAITNNN